MDTRTRRLRAVSRASIFSAALAGMAGCENMIVLGGECEGAVRSCLESEPDPEPEPDAGTRLPDAGEPTVDACSDGALDGACACSTPVLLAGWSFDESDGDTSREATGRGPAGTLVNFSATPWIEGYAGGALQFDGSDDYVRVGPVGAIRTLSLWLKPETTHVVTSETASMLPSAHGPLDQWSNPELAYADDEMDAVTGTLIGVQSQHWREFHLAQQLPAQAQILGITVSVDTGNLGLLGYFAVELSADGGASHTDARYSWGQLIAGSNLRQAGGADRLWGRVWTPAELLDANFAVRASFGGIANTMAVDYLAVQVHYAEQVTPRTILSLNESTRLEFASDRSMRLALVDWPDASIYVNGSLDAPLTNAWNQVVITASTPKVANDLRFGDIPSAFLSAPFQGAVDEVLLFEAELSPAEIGTPYAASSECSRSPMP